MPPITRKFYVARGNIVNTFSIFTTRPELWMNKKLQALWTNATNIANLYRLDQFIPVLNIPPAAMWLIEVTTTDENTCTVRVLDRAVEKTTKLY